MSTDNWRCPDCDGTGDVHRMDGEWLGECPPCTIINEQFKRIAELEAEVARLKSEREWQPIETAPKLKTVLVWYKNVLGNGRKVRASYYPPNTLESDETESGWCEEGWYEESEAYEYLMPLEGEPTHWMPMPEKPYEAMKGGA